MKEKPLKGLVGVTDVTCVLTRYLWLQRAKSKAGCQGGAIVLIHVRGGGGSDQSADCGGLF